MVTYERDRFGERPVLYRNGKRSAGPRIVRTACTEALWRGLLIDAAARDVEGLRILNAMIVVENQPTWEGR